MSRNLKILVLIIFLGGGVSCKVISRKTVQKRSHTDTSKQQAETVDQKPLPTEMDESTKDDSLKKPGDTKVVFPGFSAILHGFKAYNDFDQNNELEYDGDSSEVKINAENAAFWILTLKKDTIHLTNGAYNDFRNRLFEMVPENKTDAFRISYSIKVGINEAAKAKGVTWNGMTDYISLKDSLRYFFRLPKFVDFESAINSIKKKLKLKETLIKYNDGDYGEQTEIGVLYKNKPCFIGSGDLNLKIEWFNENKLKEIKYITFYDTDID